MSDNYEKSDRRINDVVLKLKEDSGKMRLDSIRLFVTGAYGHHIVSKFHDENINCDCIAFKTGHKCTHVKVLEMLLYLTESILPVLDIEHLFDKVKQEPKTKIDEKIECQVEQTAA